jgi:hypothetical protein
MGQHPAGVKPAGPQFREHGKVGPGVRQPRNGVKGLSPIGLNIASSDIKLEYAGANGFRIFHFPLIPVYASLIIHHSSFRIHHFSLRPRQGQDGDAFRARGQKGCCAFMGRGPGCKHVIDQQNLFSGYLFRAGHGKCVFDILLPFFPAQSGLGCGFPVSYQAVFSKIRDPAFSGGSEEGWPMPEEHGGLVKAPFPDPGPVQGDGNDTVNGIPFKILPETGEQQRSQRPGELDFMPIFKGVNRGFQRSVIEARRPNAKAGARVLNAPAAFMVFADVGGEQSSAPGAERGLYRGKVTEAGRAQKRRNDPVKFAFHRVPGHANAPVIRCHGGLRMEKIAAGLAFDGENSVFKGADQLFEHAAFEYLGLAIH